MHIKIFDNKKEIWSYSEGHLQSMYSRYVDTEIHLKIINSLEIALNQAKKQLNLAKKYEQNNSFN